MVTKRPSAALARSGAPTCATSVELPASAVDSCIAYNARANSLPRPGQCSAMSYFFSTPVDIDIVLEDSDERQTVDVKLDKNRKEKVPLYLDGESVKGQVTIRPKDGKRLEHTGIKVQFIGTIGAYTTFLPAAWREAL